MNAGGTTKAEAMDECLKRTDTCMQCMNGSVIERHSIFPTYMALWLYACNTAVIGDRCDKLKCEAAINLSMRQRST